MPETLSEMVDVIAGSGDFVNVQLQNFTNEHLSFIEKWEESGEIYNYLSHSRPKCLCDGATEELWQTTRLFMICLGNNIVGCVWLEDLNFIEKNGKLSIYIGESHCRGLGVGKEVIKEILKLAFGLIDLDSVILHVREKNARAINCYKSSGFSITKESPKRQFTDGSYQGTFEMTIKRDL